MPEQSDNLSTLIKQYVTTEYITIATFLIYAWGFLYNYLFYNGFGINIIKYLSLQEILIETLVYVVVIGISSIIIISIQYYTVLGYYLIRKKNRTRNLVFITRRKSYIYLKFLNRWSMLNTIMFLMSSFIGLVIFKFDLSILFKILLPVFTISLSVNTYFISFLREENIWKIIVFSSITFFAIVSMYIIADKQTQNILENKSIKKEVITLSSGVTYTTNDSILYIGETSSTIFLFDQPLNNTIIINKASVIQTQLINQATVKFKKGDKKSLPIETKKGGL